MHPVPDISNIELSKWIDYTNSLIPFDTKQKEIADAPDCHRKNVLLTKIYVDKCYHSYAYWGGTDTPFVDDTIKWHSDFAAAFDALQPVPVTMPDISQITFGQFVDSKMITADTDKSRWELLRYIIAIYGYGKYHHEFAREDSPQFEDAGTKTLSKALAVLQWFDQLNETINTTYTVFQDSGEDEKPNMKEHMQRWGWINFLKSIAKTKVFDIAGSGQNSIDCARAASLDDVLVWASEEKDYNLAAMRDMEIKN